MNIKKFIKYKILSLSNFFKHTERIAEAKNKWNKLASKNSKYYVLTSKGESISEEDFRAEGLKDVEQYFLGDELIESFLKSGQNSNVLEIGCGVGRLSEFIAPHVSTLNAVDISEEMIKQAKGRLSNVQNINFISNDGLKYPLPDDSIDITFSFIVFQHMPSREVVRKNVEDIARVLKPNGIAKIQLRGVPTSKDNWFYGPSFNVRDVGSLIQNTSLRLVKHESVGTKYFWVWLQKMGKKS